MLEWLKRHAWKACIRQKRISGSNPDLSARKGEGAGRQAGFFIGQGFLSKASFQSKTLPDKKA